jgi:hypothetical protein
LFAREVGILIFLGQEALATTVEERALKRRVMRGGKTPSLLSSPAARILKLKKRYRIICKQE